MPSHCVSEKGGQDKVHLRWEIERKPTTGGRSASAAPQSIRTATPS